MASEAEKTAFRTMALEVFPILGTLNEETLKVAFSQGSASDREELARLRSENATLHAENGRLRERVSSVEAAQRSRHPVGLCEDKACATCQAQAQQIAKESYEAGMKQAGEQIDAAIFTAAGEPFRDQVAKLIERGMGIMSQQVAVSK